MKFDLQDGLLLAGVGSLEAGVASFSWKVALILFGMICLFSVMLIERAKAKSGNSKP